MQNAERQRQDKTRCCNPNLRLTIRDDDREAELVGAVNQPTPTPTANAQTVRGINRQSDTGTPLSTFRTHLIEPRLVRFSASRSRTVSVRLFDDEAARSSAIEAVNTISRPGSSLPPRATSPLSRHSRAVTTLILWPRR